MTKRVAIHFIAGLLILGMLVLTPPPLAARHTAHEYHVSVTQMQYNPAQKLLEISIRVFTDDLEKALSAENGNRRFTLSDNDQNSPFVEKYLRKYFTVSDARQQVQPFQFLGKEQEADATWMYLEVPVPGGLPGWTLQNNVLMELFSDQMNMLNLKLPGGKKTILFKKGQSLHPLQ
jgi:hypothetical protein